MGLVQGQVTDAYYFPPMYDENKIYENHIYYDTSSRRLIVGMDGIVPCVEDRCVPISVKTASRIQRKENVIMAIEEFVSSEDIRCLCTEERYYKQGESCAQETAVDDLQITPYDNRCWCRKDGVTYCFYTEGETFIPLKLMTKALRYHVYNEDTFVISKAQFKALILFRVFSQSISMPLLDKEPEDYVEFRFYGDGYATDGTGILYTGKTKWDNCPGGYGWKDEKVHLVPYIPCGNEEPVDSHTEEQIVSADEFSEICIRRSKINYEARLRMEKDCHERRRYDNSDMTRDLMESGLMDIYGEPGGWQFNNED